MNSQTQPRSSVNHISDKLFEKLDTHRIPSLNQVLIEILNCCDQEDVTFAVLAEIIKKDPAFTSKMLMIANSAAFAPSQPFTSLDRALATLGLESIKTIAITTSIRQVLDTVQVDKTFDLRQFWKRSLCCGFIAKDLGRLTDYPHVDEAYLAGLLHNVGSLIMASNFPQESACVNANSYGDLYRIERKQFGFNSCDIGGWLTLQWGLSRNLSDAIRDQQETAERVRDAHHMVKLIYLSSRLCLESPVDQDYLNTALAEHLFGLTTSLVRKIVRDAGERVRWVAQSMSIELGRDAPKSDHSRLISIVEPAVRVEVDGGQGELTDRIRQQCLTDSIRPLLDSAQNVDDLVGYIQVCGYVLFGFTDIILFVPDPSGIVLVNKGTGPSHSSGQRIEVPTTDDSSVIARAYGRNQPVKFVCGESSTVSSTIDRRVSRACSSDGIVCIPVDHGGRAVGVLVTGLQVLQLPQYQKLLRQMQTVANLTGKYLAKLIESEIDENPGADYAQLSDNSRIRKLVHEANNPLTILKNYIQILSTRQGSSDLKEFKIVSGEIDRVGRIIRRISEESNPSDVSDAVDVAVAVRELVKLCQDSYFIPHTISVKILADDKPLPIALNADAFKQIMVNLIKNAVEALGDSGKMKITIKNEVVVRATKYVEVVLADNGPGLPQEVLDNLYKPVSSSKGKNRGIGLVIVKNLVRELEGIISCKSRSGKGTSFQLLFPHSS